MKRRLATRRGQTAHEFLTTYAWNILLLLGLLLVMSFFTTNPDSLRPTRCAFPTWTNIECASATATTNGLLTLHVYNKRLTPALLEGISCAYDGDGARVTTKQGLVHDTVLAPGTALPAKERSTVSCRFDGDNPFAGALGEKRDVTFSFFLTDDRVLPGKVTVLVEG